VRPGRGLVALLALWAALGLAAALWRPLLAAWWASAGALALGAAAEWLRLRRLPAPGAERSVAAALPLGVASEVELRLVNRARRRLVLEVADAHPDGAEAEGLPRRVVLPGTGGAAALRYRLRPTRRGNHHFGSVDLLVRSPGDLWRRRMAAGTPQPVRVLPNFQAVARYALLAEESWLARMGVRIDPRRGEGLEFRELREYRAGDSLRRIDWKATSRRRKLISRGYQDERDQQVVFLVDCGRRMRARDAELSHFDHALNAVLLLAYVALRQGDAVGFLSFGGERRWLAPVKGAAGLGALVQRVYDLEPSLQVADYLEAATVLMARQRRRALVVLLSNLRDEDADDLLPALRLLRGRNVVLLASLREAVLRQVREQVPDDFDGALRLSAVERYLELRTRTFDRLRSAGALALDVEPALLPRHIVRSYLQIKRSGLL
jgi:uncharacterized protein (DUF58 family)